MKSNLTFTKSVSLTVRQGGFYGFIGPNCAGKFTTVRTLSGLIRPSGGKVQINSGDG